MTRKTRAIKPAPTHTDPLVLFLFDEMARQGVSAREIETRTGGVVDEQTILQWRHRAVPTIVNLRLCVEALGFEICVGKSVLAPGCKTTLEINPKPLEKTDA